MKKAALFTMTLLTAAVVTGCGSKTSTAPETTAAEPTAAQASEGQQDLEAVQELTGKGKGFGGEIVAHVTVDNGIITAVSFEGSDETPAIGGAALEELAKQMVEAGSTEIDGVSGATVTADGCVAAVLNALDPEANPYEEPAETESAELVTEIEPVVFPEDRKVVSATTYGIYTKKADSPQDAVLKTTLYWDETNQEIYDIRFLQAMLPWDDNGANGGWANMTDESVVEALGDAVISFAGDVHGSTVDCDYARYLQIGDMVWTGELGSDPACEQAVVYSTELDGEKVLLNDYVADEAGGQWYHEAALSDVYILKTPEKAESAGDDNVAMTYKITYKETNGHGESYWPSELKFSGNMEAIKTFVKENGFDYGYYADGGITQNEDGIWQTVDAVSGATLDETPTYLDTLKMLYEKIRNGEYTEEN